MQPSATKQFAAEKSRRSRCAEIVSLDPISTVGKSITAAGLGLAAGASCMRSEPRTRPEKSSHWGSPN